MTAIRMLLLLTALIPVLTHAQPKTEAKVKVKARMGEFPMGDASIMPTSLIASNANAVMLLRNPEFDRRPTTKQEARLELYDRDKLVFLRNLEPAIKGPSNEKLLLEDLVVFRGKPMLIARNQRDEEVALFWQHVDPNLTRQPPAFDRICTFPVQLDEPKPQPKEPGQPKPGTPTRQPFRAIVGADSSHMLIHSAELRDKDEQRFYLFALVDRTMAVKWQHLLRLDPRAEGVDLVSAMPHTDGSAYVILRNRSKENAFNGSTTEVVLYRLDAADITPAQLPMEEGKRPTGGLLMGARDGALAYHGLYATDSRGSAAGNFTCLLPKGSAEWGAPWLAPFPGEGLGDGGDRSVTTASDAEEDEEVKALLKSGKKFEERLDWGTDVAAVLHRSDGGFFIINAVRFTIVRREQGARREFLIHYHGPVQARSFDKDGKEQWSTVFQRWVDSLSPIVGAPHGVLHSDRLFLFLLDSENMAALRKAKQPVTTKDVGVPYSVYAAFDDKGAFITKSILSSGGAQDLICGARILTAGKDEHYLLGTGTLNGSTYQPVRIDLIKETAR